MRKVLLCFILSAVAFTISAQSSEVSNEVSQAVTELTSLYDLDTKQVEQMTVIQQRHFKNLADIASLKDTDKTKYLQKLSANRKGTEASMYRMLNQTQRVIFNEQQAQRRIAESEIIKELKAQGLSSEEIRLQVIERTNG
ncbi:MAG: hypothetical protein DWQ02_12015 [Bacteroidetes bacterium]|nr:MAG: hypothetical protein DWQ02_12015 [Bacteroidota bacterium]